MKTINLLIFCCLIATVNAYAQNGINYARNIAAGGKLTMSVDSSAKNIIYAATFPNQPHTAFNYLPSVNNLNIRINFRKNINIPQYRYTILVDDRPIVVNKSIDMAQLKDSHAGGDEELFSTTSLGTFNIKGKVITTLVYTIEKPQDIDKSVFYGQKLPKPKIKAFSKRFKTDKGVDYKWTLDPKEELTKLSFSDKDEELTIVKDKSDIDYLYFMTIKDMKTEKIIFNATTWQYGGIVTENHGYSPLVRIEKDIFKKSGVYEISVQPLINWTNCADCNFPKKEIESYTAKYKISITLSGESYTKKDL